VQHLRRHLYRRTAPTERLNKSVDGAWVAILLDNVRPRRDKRKNLLHQRVPLVLFQDLPDPGKELQPHLLGEIRVHVTQLSRRDQELIGRHVPRNLDEFVVLLDHLRYGLGSIDRLLLESGIRLDVRQVQIEHLLFDLHRRIKFRVVHLHRVKLFAFLGRVDHRRDAGQDAALVRHLDAGVGDGGHQQQLDALLDPVVLTDGLPVLRTHDVEEAVVEAPPHRLVEHLEEFGSDVRLVASQPRQKRRFQF
jgi:hypothetical protein